MLIVNLLHFDAVALGYLWEHRVFSAFSLPLSPCLLQKGSSRQQPSRIRIAGTKKWSPNTIMEVHPHCSFWNMEVWSPILTNLWKFAYICPADDIRLRLGIARTPFGSALGFCVYLTFGEYRMRLGRANRASPFALRSTFAIFDLRRI